MKKVGTKLLAIILALCTFASLSLLTVSATVATSDEAVGAVIATPDEAVGANISTTDDAVGAETNTSDFKYEIYNSFARITGYTGESGLQAVLNIPNSIDGHVVKYIKEQAFKGKTFETVHIPDSVTYIGRNAFSTVCYAFLGSNVEKVDNEAFGNVQYIYLPKSLKTIEYLGVYARKAVYYEGSFDDFKKINIYQSSILYDIQHSTYKGDLQFSCNCSPDIILGQSKVVSDDFKLTLTAKNENFDIGEIILEPGTYELKVHKADGFGVMHSANIQGYDKIVNDTTTGGLTTDSKYKRPIKLVASGGIYRFIFNNKTNVFMIKRIGELPEVYTVGDINIKFNHIEGTSYYVANGLTFPEYYSSLYFKISKNGKILGTENYELVNHSWVSKNTTLSENYAKTLYMINRYLGPRYVYSFIFNYDTNELSAHRNLNYKGDFAIEGDFTNTDLNDDNGTSDIATATI
ncbi:MAG: leucine-rich repeat domain-containing protein, partial [Ruminococcus sp.]|nr:leucine-rich repeat domain-containing protein [Ruminococcus sp.]